MINKKLIWLISGVKSSKRTDPLFLEAAKKQKVKMVQMTLTRFKFVIDKNDDMIWYYKGEKIEKWPDLVFYRQGKGVFYKELFRTYCDLRKIRMVNRTEAIRRAKDKLWTHMLLAKHKIKSPAVALIKPGYRFDKKMKFPLVLKQRYQLAGRGTFLVNNKDEIKQLVPKEDLMHYFVQEYIEESKGIDIRVLLIGNKIIGAYKRINIKDFRSNIAVGGKAQILDNVPKKLKILAKKISKASGLDLIGIDFLIKGDDYLVIEINDFPGFKGFVDRHWRPKVDFATPIVKHLVRIIDERAKVKERRAIRKERIAVLKESAFKL